jgi:hypothetical protein
MAQIGLSGPNVAVVELSGCGGDDKVGKTGGGVVAFLS